jgi:hypothetical protein
MTEGNNAISAFKAMMMSPVNWQASHADKATVAPAGFTSDGYAVSNFTVSETGTVYRFRHNTAQSIFEWENKVTGLYEIFYQ